MPKLSGSLVAADDAEDAGARQDAGDHGLFLAVGDAASDHAADDARDGEHEHEAGRHLGEGVLTEEGVEHAARLVPVGLARPEHEGEDADDHEERRDGRQPEDDRDAGVGARIHTARQIDEQVDADHLNDEEHPFARPEPDEGVDERRDPAGGRDRGGEPDARTRDGAEHVAEDEEEEAVAADEGEVGGLVPPHR